MRSPLAGSVGRRKEAWVYGSGVVLPDACAQPRALVLRWLYKGVWWLQWCALRRRRGDFAGLEMPDFRTVPHVVEAVRGAERALATRAVLAGSSVERTPAWPALPLCATLALHEGETSTWRSRSLSLEFGTGDGRHPGMIELGGGLLSPLAMHNLPRLPPRPCVSFLSLAP